MSGAAQDGPVLVLAHGHDRPALWACERLRARGNVPVELVLVEALEPLGTVWSHRLGSTAPPTTDVRLTDGRRLRTGAARAVLNRLLQPPLAATSLATPLDADYARGELNSFAASWIRALAPRVLNQPTPQGLSGRWRTTLQWRTLGAAAGLPIVPLTLDADDPQPVGATTDDTPSTTYLVIDGELIGADDAPAAVRAGTRRLAAAADTTLLGVRFDPSWRLLDATPQPDFLLAGELGIDALERALLTA